RRHTRFSRDWSSDVCSSDLPTMSMGGWSSDWSVGIRIWVERAGQAILGKGRLELLEGIDHWRSISAAARQMGMSYRRAWLLVQRDRESVVEGRGVGWRGGGR